VALQHALLRNQGFVRPVGFIVIMFRYSVLRERLYGVRVSAFGFRKTWS
jgi:hypothetical protein